MKSPEYYRRRGLGAGRGVPKDTTLKGAVRCTAKRRRTGERCKRAAVAGRTVCTLHGGHAGTQPMTTGRYSRFLPRKLKRLYEEFLQDVQINDLSPEIALARMRVATALDKGKVNYQFLDDIRKLVESKSKVEFNQKYLINVDQARALVAFVVDAVVRYVSAEEERNAILADIEKFTSLDSSTLLLSEGKMQ